ncbi:MAG: GNAT family N-acetyltransferase [Gemmatimonadaceae bacterium]|nr:GNAT family N-acetyltransferase [Gemmatimonadaceae bacterium]
MKRIETPRTCLREMHDTDAAFICDLLNQPSFLQYIGDRHVRTPEQAATFIETRYRQSYRDHGYGLYVVEQRDTAVPMGICGFVRRDVLPDADMGFAFLPQFEGWGYAYEAATSALEHARVTLGLTRVLAIAQPDNARSHALLRRLRFDVSGEVLLPGETVTLRLFVRELNAVRRPLSP